MAITLNGTTGITTPALDTSGDVTFADNDKAIFGAGSDLQIYHDGSNSYIDDAGTGNLLIRGSAITRIQSYIGEDMVVAVTNGAVNLYHNNAEKLATTATGIDVTGVITTDGMTTSADINFGDNDKAIFGAGSDLKIYHDGSDSFITDTGAGNLQIWGGNFRLRSSDGSEAVIDGNSGGAVTLYHDNAAKLATTATGVTVTGTVAATAYTGDGSALTGVGGSTDFGAVGTYCAAFFLSENKAGSGLGRGTTHAGSGLTPGMLSTSNTDNGGTTNSGYDAGTKISIGKGSAAAKLSGTWRLMGESQIQVTNKNPWSLFVRIS
jgi:hypothetical protein